MGNGKLPLIRFEDGPHAIPRRARLGDRRENGSPPVVVRAVVAREEQPPSLAGHHNTGMAGPGGILTAALHDGSLGDPLPSVERRGHVQASNIAIESRVDHQVAARGLHHAGGLNPVIVTVAGESGVDCHPYPFPCAAPGLNRLKYPPSRSVVPRVPHSKSAVLLEHPRPKRPKAVGLAGDSRGENLPLAHQFHRATLAFRPTRAFSGGAAGQALGGGDLQLKGRAFLPGVPLEADEQELMPATARKGGDLLMATGTVKWFSSERRYGFISQENGPDVFVHASALQGEGTSTLKETQKVAFAITHGPQGPEGLRPPPFGRRLVRHP
jgi:CspA family cold shock protein